MVVCNKSPRSFQLGFLWLLREQRGRIGRREVERERGQKGSKESSRVYGITSSPRPLRFYWCVREEAP